MSKINKTISNKLGLHARASAKLTKVAASYPCEIWISAVMSASGSKRSLYRLGLAA